MEGTKQEEERSAEEDLSSSFCYKFLYFFYEFFTGLPGKVKNDLQLARENHDVITRIFQTYEKYKK